MSRILETVLTARNLLSPELLKASRDVLAFNSTVAGANEKAAASSAASARVQQSSANTSATAASRAATASTVGAGTQSAAAEKIAASNVKASTSASASAQQQMRAHTKAAESASLSARVQETANRSLAASNGLLGTSLTPLTAGLGAVGLGLAYAAYSGMTFDKSMSRVAAASQASGADLERLRQAALAAGADTQYSAEESAAAITELSKAGVSTADVLNGGLKGALNLAAAGEMEVADAAEVGATALSVFNLKGNQMGHVADLLAAGAGKAQGSVHDMGAALNQSALVADQAGLSIEDTTGALAMFASNGLLGSDAGTSFKTMLQALTPNSEKAAKTMDAMGLSAYDAQGNFVGLEAYAGQLRTGLAGLTEEQRNTTLETIFGSDAVRAASILYKEGAPGVAEWAAKVDDAGFAARQAAANNDNLAGDLEKLGGAAKTVFTAMGEGAQGPLREVVQMLTHLVNAGGDVLGFFNGLPGPLQAAVAAFAAWALVGGKVMGAVDGIRTRLVTLREEQELQRALLAAQQGSAAATAATYGTLAERIDATTGVTRNMGTSLDTVSTKANTAKAAIGGFGRAIGPELLTAGTVLLVAEIASEFADLGDAGSDAKQQIAEFNQSLKDTSDNSVRLDSMSSGIKKFQNDMRDAQKIVAAADNEGWFDKYVWQNPFSNDYYEGVDNARTSVGHYRDEISKLEKQQQQADTSTQALSVRYGISRDEVVRLADKYDVDLSGALGTVTGKFAESGAAADIASGAVASIGNAAGMSQTQIEEATKAQEEWLTTLQDIGTAFVDPLATYTGLLDEKTAAERAAAEETAASTESSKDSWKDYVGDVTVSLDEYATKLEEQLLAQDNWRANIATITQRGGMEVGQILAGMGVEGAQIAAQMATAMPAEFERLKNDLIREAQGATAGLDQEMKVMAAVGAAGASATAWAISEQLGIGVGRVAEIAAQYGLNLAMGVDPLLAALGKPGTVSRLAGAQSLARQRGLYDGGYTGDGDKYEPAGIVHRGEYVLTKEQTARLGIDRIEEFANNGYANGGFVTAADVPRPRSTAPYGPPISTAADATMQKGFDEVQAWLTANVGVAGSGAVTGQWMSLWNLVKGQIPQARINSTYRPGDPGKHGQNKAIDFGYGTGPGGAGSAGLASINRLLHDQVGKNLYELIYDGIGDDRPDLKRGMPSVYSAATRAQHHNHVHAAVADTGGVMATGTAHLNLSGRPERTLSPQQTEAFDRWMAAPAAMPGYGGPSGGRGGQTVVVVEKRTEIAVDASNRDHRAIAQAIVAEQREQEWLSTP